MLSKHWEHIKISPMIQKLLITCGPITLIPRSATEQIPKKSNMLPLREKTTIYHRRDTSTIRLSSTTSTSTASQHEPGASGSSGSASSASGSTCRRRSSSGAPCPTETAHQQEALLCGLSIRENDQKTLEGQGRQQGNNENHNTTRPSCLRGPA